MKTVYKLTVKQINRQDLNKLTCKELILTTQEGSLRIKWICNWRLLHIELKISGFYKTSQILVRQMMISWSVHLDHSLRTNNHYLLRLTTTTIYQLTHFVKTLYLLTSLITHFAIKRMRRISTSEVTLWTVINTWLCLFTVEIPHAKFLSQDILSLHLQRLCM